MKVWDRAGIELATPGSAVRLASVARHVTDCATRPVCVGCVSGYGLGECKGRVGFKYAGKIGHTTLSPDLLE